MTTEIDAGKYQWSLCPHCDTMVPWDHFCTNDPAHIYTIATFTNPYTGKVGQRYIELSDEAKESLKDLFE